MIEFITSGDDNILDLDQPSCLLEFGYVSGNTASESGL